VLWWPAPRSIVTLCRVISLAAHEHKPSFIRKSEREEHAKLLEDPAMLRLSGSYSTSIVGIWDPLCNWKQRPRAHNLASSPCLAPTAVDASCMDDASMAPEGGLQGEAMFFRGKLVKARLVLL
jgi:hypothetical protein